MLDSSSERLARLSPDLRVIAENMAAATMVSEFGENLIPAGDAERIAEEHKAGETEEWSRAVNAAVSSLLALHRMGYALTRVTTAEPAAA